MVPPDRAAINICPELGVYFSALSPLDPRFWRSSGLRDAQSTREHALDTACSESARPIAPDFSTFLVATSEGPDAYFQPARPQARSQELRRFDSYRAMLRLKACAGRAGFDLVISPADGST